MAGTHQIWRMNLADNKVELYAGNGREDIVDGALLPVEPFAQGSSSFAQPSGLTGDDTWLYVADSEGSSIRAVPFDRTQKVKTIIGTAHLPVARLFTFGDVDGESPDARLQHALGVARKGDKLYVTDTYNHKIKIVDPKAGTSLTLVGDGKPGATDQPAEFHEPCGVAIAGEKLFVADTNNHAIRVIDLAKNNAVSTLDIAGLNAPTPRQATLRGNFEAARQLKLDPTSVKRVDGKITLRLDAVLPLGFKVNPLAPLVYQVEAVGDAGPLDAQALGKVTKAEEPKLPLEITLPVTSDSGEVTLRVGLNYYYCANDPGGLCKMSSVQWTVPLKLDPAADSSSVSLSATAE
jgi:DNA-binding beta-propeller fold protein YncE